MPIETYRSLMVWKKSVDFVVLVYQFPGRFPKNEQYGLTSQMQRAAVSIPSNIAEGKERQSARQMETAMENESKNRAAEEKVAVN